MSEKQEQDDFFWQGHLDKKCPRCGGILALREFSTPGSDSGDNFLDVVSQSSSGIFFNYHIIWYVQCACGYQKRTNEMFLTKPEKKDDKKKKEFSENIKKKIL